jgi:hypothetical protein
LTRGKSEQGRGAEAEAERLFGGGEGRGEGTVGKADSSGAGERVQACRRAGVLDSGLWRPQDHDKDRGQQAQQYPSECSKALRSLAVGPPDAGMGVGRHLRREPHQEGSTKQRCWASGG